MIREFLIRAAAVLPLAVPLASPALAQQPGEEIQGVITAVNLQGSPRTMIVRQPDGREVTAPIANRTIVVFQDPAYPKPDLNFLKPGLSVRFKFAPDTVERIHIVSVPPDYRPPDHAKAPAAAAAGRQVKVRIIETAAPSGGFVADMAGRRETFRLKDPALMQSFRRGDLVVISLEGAPGAEVVADIRSAALSGRVVSIDSRRDRVTIDVNGQSETYGVADDRLLSQLRVGDTVRFEFEERPGGQKVITALP